MERRFRQAQRPELLFGVPTRFPSYFFSIKRAQEPHCRGEKKEKENVECFLRQLELEKKEKFVEDSLILTEPNTPASKKKEEEKLCEKRRILKEEWDKWVSEWKQLHKEEKWQRQLLRDGEASDEESEESEEEVLLDRVQVWVGYTHEEQGRKMERIKKEDPLSRYQLQRRA
ncbi:hypothetical protein C1H46_011913 [Malus baccata]|uniref:Uncharacterized protein n=1 Tax=Malus baccata TaxID=106549 RepID=A0A540MUM8_MALBA|nr:hypothetical protein C1H46_011913 [Malus baccata]